MKVTIIPADTAVYIDGVCLTSIDMSSVDSSIHAVQWDGSNGEIEYELDSDGNKPANKAITSISDFQTAIDLWETKKTEIEAAAPA